MHRSGTSALTGVLNLCGAWVGEASELTDANAENLRGFWERRDMREICDRLLHAAGADWWKVARFEFEAIPHAVLTEERAKFSKLTSALNEHSTWALKEPRLCFLLPVFRDCIRKPICIHIIRNPLEVARSLKARDGFCVSAGLSLWEAYNRSALSASENLPRVVVSHEALMLCPEETLGDLLERLTECGVTGLDKLNEDRLKQFIDPSLYRRRAGEKEASEFLSSSQLELWQAFRSGRVFDQENIATISTVTRQQLLDLESVHSSLRCQRERTSELSGALLSKNRTIDQLRSRAAGVTAERDELQARTRALEAAIEARQATIEAHEATITDLRLQAVAWRAEREERQATIEAREAAIRALDATIRGLLSSTSWRATAPLRAVSRTFRCRRRTLRRVLRQLCWLCTGRISRAAHSMRWALAISPARVESSESARPIEVPDRVSEAIRESRRQHVIGKSPQPQSHRDKKRLKITVIAWDLAHNPLGRAYLLADALRNEYDVELIGAIFPDFGNDVWKPFRDCNRVVIKCFPGARFPAHFETMKAVAQDIEGDVLYVSKPRLPSLELAILAKMKRNRPIILDIDDHELSFFENRLPISLEELRVKNGALDTRVPYGEAWTRYCETLIPLVDQITVSNEALRGKYGGIVLPHIRDECDFDPTLYPRETIRRALGFAPEDRVILFAGTPRKHKGLSQLIAALRELDRQTYRLLVVGSSADGAVASVFRGVDPSRVTLVSDVPFCDLPGYLSAADLIPLLQDEDDPTSAFQMPAKFTDALAMGIPIVASNVPPLMNAANDGLVELLGTATAAQKIEEIFSNHAIRKEHAAENRSKFLGDYSYAGNVPKLTKVLEGHSGCLKPVPAAFSDLVEYQRRTFSSTRKLRNASSKVISCRDPADAAVTATAAATQRRADRAKLRAQRSYVDDNLDVVFFWKQNDTGIYGRRQDMFVKYLAEDPRVSRIFHFDAPVNLFRSLHMASKATRAGRCSHTRLVIREALRRRLGLANRGKVRFDTFIHISKLRVPRPLGHVLPAEDDYLKFLSRRFRRHRIGQRRTILWICPVNLHYSSLEKRLDPDLVVADVIDDERNWQISEAYRDKLSLNYEEVLAGSDLVLTNCKSVFQTMHASSDNIHLLPNAAELLEEESKPWPKPRDLERLSGPVIGYVGNLDVARIDLDLLRNVVSERSKWNFVFIGSMHKGDEIRELEKYTNVRFLGARVHEQALRYIRHFDVAIIPHLDNGLTRSMNPLKLYVYHSLLVPVVSTAIENIGDFGEFVRVARSPQEFIRAIDECLRNDPLAEDLSRLRKLLNENSWPERAKRVLELIEREFEKS